MKERESTVSPIDVLVYFIMVIFYNSVLWLILKFLDEVKNHLIPEVAAALNAVMTKFNCSVCCLDNSMKDGITCRKIEQTNEENELHTFCIKCIKEFAATDEAILAHGGIGLSCMQTDCEHALMLSKYTYISN
jgi:hypothetical protein